MQLLHSELSLYEENFILFFSSVCSLPLLHLCAVDVCGYYMQEHIYNIYSCITQLLAPVNQRWINSGTEKKKRIFLDNP